ncbi:MAG: ribonuclease P protein component [Armatimonadetes bacterium]|nr:ribonuclease P protein component [Armatimonadota bacterium]
MLVRKHRLTSGRDFRLVLTKGKTYTHKLVILKVLPTSRIQPSRFAFSASSKLGTAVARNRAKRLLREAVRLLVPQIKQTGLDAVLIARPPIREAKVNEVLVVLKELFRNADILQSSGEPGEGNGEICVTC